MPDELSHSRGDNDVDPDNPVCSEEEAEALRDLAALDVLLGSRGESPDQRAQQLATDARVVEVLRQHGCAGPLFDRLAERLMPYGRRTLLKMMSNGSVFKRAARLGRPVPQNMITADWTAEDRDALAVDSALDGLELFRERALVQGRWCPEGGASLDTFYVGATLLRFPRRYKQWFRDREMHHAELRQTVPEELADYLAGIPDQRADDPETRAAARDEVDRLWPLLPEAVRQGVTLQAMGYSQAEAAAHLDLSTKALESRLGRARAQIRAKYSTEGDRREGDAR